MSDNTGPEVLMVGSGSGFATAERFCTSIALLVEPHLYLFDCGEPAGASLFRHGIDPLSLRTLFISHMHPDHVGGLAPLLFSAYLPGRSSGKKFKPWSVNRSDDWYRASLSFPADTSAVLSEKGNRIGIVMPSEAIDPIRTYLRAVYLDPSVLPFALDIDPIELGPTYADERISVTAVANDHLKVNPGYASLPERFPEIQRQSYSFRVEVDGKVLVLSGDIDRLEELTPLLGGGVDTLIVEVAHYPPEEIRDYVRRFDIGRVVLTHVHPGLEAEVKRLTQAWADSRIVIAEDGMRFPVAMLQDAAS